MFSKIISGSICGMNSYLIQVEVDVSQGLPCFQMVGLPGSEVREARERVKVALKNVGIRIPPMCINVNLSPADIPKNGTMFDLPVAVGIMTSVEQIAKESVEQVLLLGELGLSGEVKPVKGVLPIVRNAIKEGIKTCILPKENAWEAALFPDVRVIGVENLKQAFAYLAGESTEELAPVTVDIQEMMHRGMEESRLDFADIHGQDNVKRAAEVAAAGFHHLLIMGPPGAGKTMLAKRLPTIMPPLSLEESLEVSSIYSISGLLHSEKTLRIERPFLNPHHTITRQALTGGGKIPAPGVISLAHRGVLFLDELPEFRRETLDALRQPLEDRKVQIARSTGTYVYPSDFMLVGAMNPCPCGYFPDMTRCRCNPYDIKKYLARISGPILDRMDICVEAQAMDFSDLNSNNYVNHSARGSRQIRESVMKAREIQKARFAEEGIICNGDMSSAQVERYCPLGRDERAYMEKMFAVMKLTARGYHKILKVARTIADLEESEQILKRHLAEAICYRQVEKLVP